MTIINRYSLIFYKNSIMTIIYHLNIFKIQNMILINRNSLIFYKNSIMTIIISYTIKKYMLFLTS